MLPGLRIIWPNSAYRMSMPRPICRPRHGSTHGYDVADHHVVSEELGGEEAHQRFCRHLGECGLGQVLDIVPNHMSLAPNNRYWWDVLENGASSRYAEYFDIDWDPAEVRLSNKVLLPILDDQYGVVLADRKIELVDRMPETGRFEVHYANHALPISPESISTFLSPRQPVRAAQTRWRFSPTPSRIWDSPMRRTGPQS